MVDAIANSSVVLEALAIRAVFTLVVPDSQWALTYHNGRHAGYRIRSARADNTRSINYNVARLTIDSRSYSQFTCITRGEHRKPCSNRSPINLKGPFTP